MRACKNLARTSALSCLEFRVRSRRSTTNLRSFSSLSPRRLCFTPHISCNSGFISLQPHRAPLKSYGCSSQFSVSLDTTDCSDETLEPAEDLHKDTVEELLLGKSDDVTTFMKMERRPGYRLSQSKRWFPYLNQFKAGSTVLTSDEVLEALYPYIMEGRMNRFRNAVNNRTYSVCLVVEGLCDFGNVSAVFRSADALGFQSVHVVSCNSSKRCNMI